MQATLCPNVIAFIEGTMERIFVNNNFPKIDLVPVQNGDSWTTARLCDQIIAKFEAKKQFPDQIVVWFDRESNPDSITTISDAVKNAFAAIGYPKDQVHCLIPDQMSENIFLADEVLMRIETNDLSYSYSDEGRNGKSVMKSLWKKMDKTYRETGDGPKLLKKARLARARPKSPGIDQFLTTFPSACWWI